MFCRLVFIAVMLSASLVWPPGSASATEGPALAVLDVESVLRGSKAGKALQDQINQIVSANQAKGQEAEGALRAEDQKLSKQRAVLSDEVYAQKRKELQSRFTREKQEFQARRKQIRMAVDQAWSRIRDAMIEITKDIATERKLDIVVSEAGTVLSAKKLDITKDVLARLDDKLSKVPLTIEAQ
jgi:outer membrane protein